MTRQRATVPIHTLMEHTTKESGSMINSMVEELSLGLTVLDMRDFTRMERRKDREDLHLQMEATMRDNSGRMRSVALETTTGQMVSHMLEIGRKTKWMATENSDGRTVRCTPVTLSTIKERGMVLSYGPMDVNILETGRQESSTELELTLAKMVRRSKESGPTEEKSDGSMKTVMMTRKY